VESSKAEVLEDCEQTRLAHTSADQPRYPVRYDQVVLLFVPVDYIDPRHIRLYFQNPLKETDAVEH